MPSSTLDPDNLPEDDRHLGRGHGIDALGPSDISDTGSDVQGGYRAIDEADLGLDRGTNEDSDTHNLPYRYGSGDAGGTGDDSTAGRAQDIELGGDIGFDRIDTIEAENIVLTDIDADSNAVDDAYPPEDAPRGIRRH
jgi:hypothetical protein